MTEEQALIQQVQSGDHEAFEQLVKRYEKHVYNLCLRMCGNAEDAKDLSQEAFLKAWRGIGFYKFESSFSTWLYRLTSNVCIDFLRRQKRRPTVSLTVEDDDTAVEQEVVDTAPSPEEVALHRERTNAVAAAMAQLEDEFRMVLTLRVIQDLPYEKIADILDIKVGTVKSRLARARLKLKKLLEDGNILEMPSSKNKEGSEHHDL